MRKHRTLSLIIMKLSGLLLTLVAMATVSQGNLLEGLLEDKIHSKL